MDSNDKKTYLIVGGKQELWAINPKTKEKLKLAKNRLNLLDLFASQSGLYYAAEIIDSQSKKVDGHIKKFNVNYIQIMNALSNKSCFTLIPPNSTNLPLEKRMISIDFKFEKNEGALKYSLNGTKGIIFSNYSKKTPIEHCLTIDGKNVYFVGRKIATLDENVLYVEEVDAKAFSRAFKHKNRSRYLKNKSFFK